MATDNRKIVAITTEGFRYSTTANCLEIKRIWKHGEMAEVEWYLVKLSDKEFEVNGKYIIEIEYR